MNHDNVSNHHSYHHHNSPKLEQIDPEEFRENSLKIPLASSRSDRRK